MAQATLRIPAPLQEFTDGAAELPVTGATVRAALADAGARHPALTRRLLAPEGHLHAYVNCFVGETDIRDVQGLETPIRDGDEITILPAVAGGAPGDGVRERLARLREEVGEVDVAEAQRWLAAGALLVDVREAEESAAVGQPPAAVRLGRGHLELEIERLAPDPDQPLLLICAEGVRSLFAGGDLQRLGYRRVRSVAGGINAWRRAGLPLDSAEPEAAIDRPRHARQLQIPEVGEAGQRRLAAGRVAIVGAGGLGSPVALYLAAAGVGTLRIIDADTVEISNLQRQVLHAEARLGRPKVESAQAALHALNAGTRVEGVDERLDATNAAELLTGADLVVDGSDNFATRYATADACTQLGVPHVFGAVYRFEGQMGVFDPAAGAPCYRCLHPQPPPPELAPSCAEAGVLGVLPGVIGMLQATEALKLLGGFGTPLRGQILCYDALSGRFRTLHLQARGDCSCRGAAAIPRSAKATRVG